MEELQVLKEQFINHLLESIPKEYISNYQWWEQEEWVTVYNEKTDLAFDIEGCLLYTSPSPRDRG